MAILDAEKFRNEFLFSYHFLLRKLYYRHHVQSFEFRLQTGAWRIFLCFFGLTVCSVQIFNSRLLTHLTALFSPFLSFCIFGLILPIFLFVRIFSTFSFLDAHYHLILRASIC